MNQNSRKTRNGIPNCDATEKSSRRKSVSHTNQPTSPSRSTKAKGTKNGSFCLIWAMMRFLLLLLAGISMMSGRSPRPAAADDFESAGTGLASVLTRAQYESYFPHHHPLYGYESLMKAASGFPLFAGEGDVTV